ncbi:MAG TPA: 1-acyl-sn-glycerol-3-phosphate acyltransferase [Acidimicrobiia bacterium]|jgi:glycerol-3-phosphate O-acyltransferase|nr:1-acyl-sn-glycerol-3-phosphate acyltransferase [Acidimicrobiia bacterium]
MTRPPDASSEILAGPEGSRVVYLLDAANDYEEKLLVRWLEDGNSRPVTRRIRSSRRRRSDADDLSDLIEAGDDVFLVPLRVVWMAPENGGRRTVGWSDVLKPGDPRDPRGLRARLIRTFRPGRVRLVAATGASVSDLKQAYHESGEIDGLEAFVTRRAWRALEKVERTLRGNRYKIPRFVPEAILSRGEFSRRLEEHASVTGADPEQVRHTAARYLKEIAATHSPYVIDLIANLIHRLYRQGYGTIRYSPDDIRRVAELGADHPLVFLPSHRSNLDRLALQFMLWENDLPPNHTAGGINLDFFPIGPLLRRTGVFFIRRSFKENELYKIVLRAYIDYLVEKRFPLEWYLEGGRSRSGRLNPPRFGLLNYVVDAQRRGKSEDVILIPVSIAYDQIQDVPDYAREAQGRGKEKESVGWLLRAIRSLRRRYGDIHIRFGDPVSVAAMRMGSPAGEDDPLGLHKLSFEVMYRIGQATPMTPISLISIALLAARGKAKTADRLADECARLVGFIKARGIPTTETLDLSGASAVTLLDWLAEHGNVSSHEAAGRTVFWLEDNQMIRVAYYRNVVVHFFVNRSIAEMSLIGAVEDGVRDPEEVKERMLGLRDLLKFEFFFPEKEEFLAAVSDDIAVDVADWEKVLETAGPLGVLARMGQPVAYWALLPFLDAYQIVGDELEATREPYDEKRFLQACLARARLYRIEERLFSAESASQVLFKSALALAANRGLLDDEEEAAPRRGDFASEVRSARSLAASGL